MSDLDSLIKIIEDCTEGSASKLYSRLNAIKNSKDRMAVSLYLDLNLASSKPVLFNQILGIILDLNSDVNKAIYAKLDANLIRSINDSMLKRLAVEYDRYYHKDVGKLLSNELVDRLADEINNCSSEGLGLVSLILLALEVSDMDAYRAAMRLFDKCKNYSLLNELFSGMLEYSMRVNNLKYAQIALAHLYKVGEKFNDFSFLNKAIKDKINDSLDDGMEKLIYYFDIAMNGITTKKHRKIMDDINTDDYPAINLLIILLKYRRARIFYYLDCDKLNLATAECKQLRSDIFCVHEADVEAAGNELDSSLKEILDEMKDGYYHNFFYDIENKEYGVSFNIDKIGSLFPKNIVYLRYEKYECEFEVFDIFPNEEIVVLEINLPILYGTDSIVFKRKGDKLVFLKAYDEFEGYDPADDEDLDINTFHFNAVTDEEE